MQFDLFKKDTIVALSTPPGMGAIAILRMSGPRSLDVLRAVFKTANKAFNEGNYSP